MTAFWARIAAGAFIFAILAAFAAASPFGARRIELRLENAAKTELEEAGIHWASAKAEKRTIRLSGVAPDSEAMALSVAAIMKIKGISDVNSDGVEIARPQQALAPAAPAPFEKDSPPAETKSAAVEIWPTEKSPAQCQAAINRTLVGRRLVFRRESAKLGDDEQALLTEVAKALGDCEGISISIEGHTDTTGPERANMALSVRRAEAVKDFLLRFDVPAVLVTRGYGETRPIASNQSAEGRAANRRIDFVISGAEAESE